MILKIILFVLMTITYNATHAMDYFSGSQAGEHFDDYHRLHPFLMDHIDNKPDSSSMAWSSICAQTEDPIAWATKAATERGNIVCLYMFIRNCCECQPIAENSNTVSLCDNYDNERSTMIMLLLMRVMFDVLNHYSVHEDCSVFSAYEIMKQKMYIFTKKFSTLPNFQKSITNALVHWKVFFTNNHELFHCAWLKNFAWASKYNKFSQGIYFGPNIDSYAVYPKHPLRSNFIFLMIEEFFSYQANILGWNDFFSSFKFPLTEKQINIRFQHLKQDFDQLGMLEKYD